MKYMGLEICSSSRGNDGEGDCRFQRFHATEGPNSRANTFFESSPTEEHRRGNELDWSVAYCQWIGTGFELVLSVGADNAVGWMEAM